MISENLPYLLLANFTGNQIAWIHPRFVTIWKKNEHFFVICRLLFIRFTFTRHFSFPSFLVSETYTYVCICPYIKKKLLTARGGGQGLIGLSAENAYKFLRAPSNFKLYTFLDYHFATHEDQ